MFVKLFRFQSATPFITWLPSGLSLITILLENNSHHLLRNHHPYLDVSYLFENSQEDQSAMENFLAEWLNVEPDRFSPKVLYPNEIREGRRGYLVFENPNSEYNMRLVDGPEFGAMLRNNNVPVLVLNACRSAHAEIQEQPKVKEEAADVHSQVRAFGSLAQEVMDAGVAGVVAMRYNVYVVTAAQFVADLYASLAQGQSLGEAVSMGRKQLAAQPLREIAFDPIPLQDWSVPVVYEAAPIQLFPKSSGAGTAPLRIDLSKTTRAEDNLPRPDVGFFGRDETILALDRAFDPSPYSGQAQSVVLLHAYAGSGKTMTAAEFARWYSQTGGLDVGAQHAAPILFTSFEQYKPMAQVLSAVEETYRPVLEQNNIQWLALSDEDRLNLTIQIFKQIPPLWIWDNVEPINGFPTSTDSAWSLAEQRELKTFLQIVTGQSKTKFLLTSRRDEGAWLGDLPARITLPPMPMQERVQLTRALANKLGRKITAVKDWMPLLRFTQGNPLTITVMVGQALRDGISSQAQIEAYLNKLHNGETAFDDEASEGRSKSLGASLSYGFEQAFKEEERKVLALLHFFQGFVDVDALTQMGKLKMITGEDLSLDEIRDLTRETGIAILDKAADIGLLTSHGGGYYTIHPALPWFFRSLFEQYYPNDLPSPAGEGPGVRSTRAFVESMGELGNYYTHEYNQGNRDVIAPLRREEPNLLHARSLARQHGWWDALTSTMQGLSQLYDHTGRRAEWKRLVEEIVPDFVGADDLPLSGREEGWRFVIEYLESLAKETRQWNDAERYTRKKVEFARSRATSLLSRPTESLSTAEKNMLRMLAVSLERLAIILREQGKAECVEPSKEAISIYQFIEDKSTEAISAFNLGHAYMQLPALRNLDEAERWYKRDLELENPNDHKGRAITLNQLSIVAYERFNDAKNEGKTKEELLKHLNAALDYSQQSLALLPPDAVHDLAVTHNQLGIIYAEAGNLERSVNHWNNAAKFFEVEGNLYLAGTVQRNLAIMLSQNGRLSDALLYAHAALCNFESYGGRAKQDEDDTKGLIARIEEAMKK
jgi:tetratricopeptide (TPR) repeat protein